jgi:tRNA wybutosine-synthesizing protein 1
MLSHKTKSVLEKQGYRIVGNHSACKICEWTKKSLVDKDTCYKETFYGIKAHRCCQMTPSLVCPNSCTYCWRTITKATVGEKIKGKINEPKEIIRGCIEAQRHLINGFPGSSKTNMKKFGEAQNPLSFAISLSGEPTVYPYLSDLIKELHRRKIISFLVTNGQFPKNIEKLDELPKQLYVSLDGPTKQIYKKLDNPSLKDYWERLNKTLELMSSLDTRTVIRITAIKGLNMFCWTI